LNFNGLHGIVSQKPEVFITTAARTSNPVCGGTSRKRLTSVLTTFNILKSGGWEEEKKK
jgi:hypothetical protein